jgi:hypothetical protein
MIVTFTLIGIGRDIILTVLTAADINHIGYSLDLDAITLCHDHHSLSA